MPSKLEVTRFFKQLNGRSMNLVEEFYDEQAVFQDPLGTHVGVAAIRKYYENLYKNVKEIDFDFSQNVIQGDVQVIAWTMKLVSKLQDGKPINVDGISIIEFGGPANKAIYHRDYFDMGEFVYEGIPVLGAVIRYIKHKLVSQKEKVSLRQKGKG